MTVTGARVRIIAAAVLFSTGGAAIKACTFTSWQVASFRSGIAALTLLLLLPAAVRGISLRSSAVAAAYAATMILFVTANKLTTAADTIFLQATAPLYILLLGPWLLRERITREDIVFMISLAAGFLLLLSGAGEPATTASNPMAGNLCAIASGFFWALTVTGLRWITKQGKGDSGASASAVVGGNVIACLVCLPFALPLPAGSALDWGVVTFLGIFQIGLAYAFLSRAIHHVPALEASLLLYVEPVLNPVWAWIWHGERPGVRSLAGGCTILIATAIKTWFDFKRGQRRPEDIPPGEGAPAIEG